MTLTQTILAVLALYLLQIFVQETSRFRFDLRGIVGNRDHPPEPGRIAARLDRAKSNMLEALPFFIPLALLALMKQGETGSAANGAMLFLGARILYVPAYVSGVPWLRSLTWLTANAGLLWMVLTLV